MDRIPRGVNLLRLLKDATQLGCKIERIRRTGEKRISHQQMERTCLIRGEKTRRNT
jgi:hypothetical protein